MNLKYTKYLTIATTLFVPFVTYAATTKKLSDVIGLIAGYMDQILALLMGFAVLAFVWFVIKYFIQTGETNKSEAAQYVMWSLIGFFVILSLWGIVNILISTFDLGQNSPGSWANLTNIFPQ